MSAKISLDLGSSTSDGRLPVDKAQEFFLGCTDAFQDMGLFEPNRIIDFIDVVRIYPDRGLMIARPIIVLVVASWQNEKVERSFIVHLDNKDIRTEVRARVKQTTKALAEEIKRRFSEWLLECDGRII